MAIKTFWLTLGGLNNSAAMTENIPTTATGTEGWTVGKTAAGNYSDFEYNVERAATTFGATALPSSWIATACFLKQNSLVGTFAAGDWTITTRWIAVSNGGALDARVRYWLGYSTDGWGSSITQLGSGTALGSTMTNLATSAAQESTATITIPQFLATNRYIYLQMALEILGAGGNNSADCLIRVGDEGSGCKVVTTDLVEGVAASGNVGTINVSGVNATVELFDAQLYLRTCTGVGK